MFEKKLQNFIDKLPPYWSLANSLWVTDTNENSVRGGACHATMTKPSGKSKYLFGGFTPYDASKTDLTMRVWDWMSDPNKSPWRKLLRDGVELAYRTEDKVLVGWVIQGPILDELPWQFFKNFAIATRVVAEKHKSFELWDYLVRTCHLDECDAFFLVSRMQTVLNDPKKLTEDKNFNIQGGHWPITDFDPRHIYSYGVKEKDIKENCYKLDWNAFRTGEIHDHKNKKSHYSPNVFQQPENINGFFQNKLSYMPWMIDKIPKKFTEGRFNKAEYYDLDDVLDSFYKWQDEENLIVNKKYLSNQEGKTL